MTRFFLPLVLLGFVCCVKGSKSPHMGKQPEDIVKTFVELSVSAREFSDRSKLQEICVGEMRRTFERMNEEAFRLIYLDSKLKLVDFKIIENAVNGENAKLTYQVTIENAQGTDPTREVNSREVELIRSQGAWYIENIRVRGSDQVAFTKGMIF